MTELKEPVKGYVAKKLGNVVFVREFDNPDGKNIACATRGRLKLGETGERSLVCVGDDVLVGLTDDDGSSGVVEEILERRTLLTRTWTINPEVADPLVANADVLAVVVSVAPHVKPGIVDRYVVAGLAGGLEPLVVLNKTDLKDTARENAKLDVYRSIGIRVIETSALSGAGTDSLATFVTGKTCAFCGHSGVGKSSLINSLLGTTIRIGEIDAKTKKGKHTTTASEMFENPRGGYIIDTPGIRSFGVTGVHSDDLITYFPEIAVVATKCGFRDCRHTDGQKGCAIFAAVDEGRITESRWDSYRKLKSELEAQETY